MGRVNQANFASRISSEGTTFQMQARNHRLLSRTCKGGSLVIIRWLIDNLLKSKDYTSIFSSDSFNLPNKFDIAQAAAGTVFTGVGWVFLAAHAHGGQASELVCAQGTN